MAYRNRLVTTISAVAAAGLGAFTVGPAQSGYATFSAGDSGLTFDVSVVEGTAWEVRTGCVYAHSGTTLSRGTLESSSTGSAIAFTAAAVLTVTMAASTGDAIKALVSGAWTISQLLANGTIYIAHSGAGSLVAELYTARAYGLAASYGGQIIPDGPNFQVLSDNVTIVNAHDPDLAGLVNGVAWTDSSGAVTTKTLAQIKAITNKGSAYAPFNGADEHGLLTLRDYLAAIGWRKAHAPEPKTAAAVTRMLVDYVALGLQDYALVNFSSGAGSYSTVAPRFAAAGFAHIAYTLAAGEHATLNGAAVTAMKAAGVTWINVDAQQSAAVTAAQTAIAGNVRVMAWNLTRHRDIDKFAAAGVTMSALCSEDPLYSSRDSRAIGKTTTKWSAGVPVPGQIPWDDSNTSSGRGSYNTASAGRYWRFAKGGVGAGPRGVLLGSLVSVGAMARNYTVTIPYTVVALASGADKRYGIQFGMGLDDAPMDAENGSSAFRGWVFQLRNSDDAGGTTYRAWLRMYNVNTGSSIVAIAPNEADAYLNKLTAAGDTGTITIQVNEGASSVTYTITLTGSLTGAKTFTSATVWGGKYPSVGLTGGANDGFTYDAGEVQIQ